MAGYCDPPKEHQFSSENQPENKGRPKGSLNTSTVVKLWLEAIEKTENPLTGKTEELTQLDLIVLEQIVKAKKGDTRAFNALMDRAEGKPTQIKEPSFMPTRKEIADLFPFEDEEAPKGVS